MPDIGSMQRPVYVRTETFAVNGREEAVDGNRNVWVLDFAVPSAGNEVFRQVATTDAPTIGELARTFGALPVIPETCAFPTARTLVEIDPAGVKTTWIVCGSDNRGIVEPYFSAFGAFPVVTGL